MGFKKKLHKFRPDDPVATVLTQRTKDIVRAEPANALSIERGVRQLLPEKVSGTMVGVWLLAPEHLRLGTWDLLCGWSEQPGSGVQSRLAMQLVHEAALCLARFSHRSSFV